MAATATASLPPPDVLEQREILAALRAVRKGDFSVRLPLDRTGLAGELAEAFNDVVEMLDRSTQELGRISRVVGKEGRITQRASLPGAGGGWEANNDSVNSLIADLARPTVEV